MDTNEAVAALEVELDEATLRARKLVDSTEARLFTVRPNPSSWSAAECLSHLSISSEEFLPVLRKAIDEARGRGVLARSAPKMDLIGHVLRWFLEPPIRKRLKTTARFVPRSVRAKAEAFAEFSNFQKKLVALLRESRDLDLQKIRVVSAFDKRVKYNVYSAFRIIAAHQRRHLWQAEQAVLALRKA